MKKDNLACDDDGSNPPALDMKEMNDLEVKTKQIFCYYKTVLTFNTSHKFTYVNFCIKFIKLVTSL